MTRNATRVACLAVMLAFGGPAASDADQIDVAGTWQVNLDCQLFATATSFLRIEEDPVSGVVSATIPGACGTVEIPDGIQWIDDCVLTPDPESGLVSGIEFDLPPLGRFTRADSIVDPPAFFAFANCWVARIISEHRYDGIIEDRGDGVATAIRGRLISGLLDMRDASGATCFTLADTPDYCSFSMRRNDVPAGSDVTVTPRAGTSVTFSAVTAPGTAAAVPLTATEVVLPVQLDPIGSRGVPIFYEVSTSASVSGIITTCIGYDDVDNDGFVDGLGLAESEVQIMHEEFGVFVNRTVSRDLARNVVCAATSELSEFVLGTGLAEPQSALCGDLDWDDLLTGTDVAILRRSLADAVGNPLPPGAADRCDVIGSPGACDVLDAVVLRRSLTDPPLEPGIAEVCAAATAL